jgi:hypothetical protein
MPLSSICQQPLNSMIFLPNISPANISPICQSTISKRLANYWCCHRFSTRYPDLCLHPGLSCLRFALGKRGGQSNHHVIEGLCKPWPEILLRNLVYLLATIKHCISCIIVIIAASTSFVYLPKVERFSTIGPMISVAMPSRSYACHASFPVKGRLFACLLSV